MGLDMNLTRRRWLTQELAGKIAEIMDIQHPHSISYVSENVMYWRKANHIHKWFVDNVQEGVDDCDEYYVPQESLERLRDICADIINDPSLGEKILPTQEGFFYGGTDYDEYYIRDVEDTYNMLYELLSTNDGDYDYYYRSSW